MRKPQGFEVQGLQEKTTNPADYARLHVKRKATVTAQLALSGHMVHDGPSGDFLITRWGQSKYCQDLESLEKFAVQVGAVKA